MTTQALLQQAKAACPQLAWLGSEEKNRAILQMADAIEANADVILAANAEDLHAAQDVISSVMLDRLRLTKDRIAAMADGMRQVAKLPDPVGEILAEVKRPNGLVIRKTAVPMGVVAIIYESRPNVTSDAAVLALKSGNVCVLRGGKEAYCSAAAIVAAMHEGLRAVGLPEAFVNLVSDTTRQSAHELMTANGLVDLLIPRGGAGLIRACVESDRPVHRDGHRHLPCVRGQGRRFGQGAEYHRKRQNQPPVRLQRGRSRNRPCGYRRAVPAHAQKAPCRRPRCGRSDARRASSGRDCAADHFRHTCGETGFRHGISGL